MEYGQKEGDNWDMVRRWEKSKRYREEWKKNESWREVGRKMIDRKRVRRVRSGENNDR